MTAPRKTPTSFRLSADAALLLWKLSGQLGVNRSAVLEMAIRELALRHAVTASRPRR